MKNYLFLASILIVNFAYSQIPTTSLVGYYSFNGNANDLSGFNNNGTVSGATLTFDRFGNANSAYSFNGINSFINLPVSSQYAFNSSFSVNLWVKIDPLQVSTLDGFNSIFSKYACPFVNNGDQFGFDLYNTNADSIKFGARNVNNSNVNASHKLYEKNKWIMLTGVKDYGTSKLLLYVNKFLVKSVPITDLGVHNSQVIISIGKSIDCATKNNIHLFKGDIDEISIYKTALTSSMIDSLFNNSNCVVKTSVTDTLKISPITGLNNLPSTFGSVKIYPNPTNGILNISVVNPSNYTLKIINNQSNTIYSTVLNNSSFQVNITGYVQGLYFIQILDSSNNLLETKKLIIE